MSFTEESSTVAVPATTDWPQAGDEAPVQPELSEPVVKEKQRAVPMVDKHYRSLLKAVSWRATGTLDTILISFLITGKLKLAVSIGLVEVFTKIGLFYVHERLWTKIRLGRAQVPDDYTI